MTSAEYRALHQKPAKAPAKASGGTSVSPEEKERNSPQIQAARRHAVGYGRRADTNTTFGVPIWVRRYHVLSEAEADLLDEAFQSILTQASQ